MKVIIAGCRHIPDPEARTIVRDAVDASGWRLRIEEIVSGGARGIDAAGEWLAQLVGVRCTRFPADWRKFGPSAGPRRNKEMAEYSDMLIAAWDGKSRGTANMIETMLAMGRPVFVYRVDKPQKE